MFLRKCAFLRIRGSLFFRHPPGLALYDGLLTVVVAGLPWTKRDKWLMPLRWSVESVLQMCGLPAKVKSKKLYLTDEVTGFHMCVEFAPCR
jgi:hypothetical protein